MKTQNAVRQAEAKDAFISTRFRSAEMRFFSARGDMKPAIEYNNRLASHWKPGISTRSRPLENAEIETFLRLSSYVDAPAEESARPEWNPLILDLGGGTGKVVDWLKALGACRGGALTYLYTDISPEMKSRAAQKFRKARAQSGEYLLSGHFALADVTTPLFLGEDWELLRQRFFPIITVCAGGTIGNFGSLQSTDDSAQRKVLEHYVHPADLALVTWLDAGRIGLSLKAYAAFARKTGLYDGQRLSLMIPGENQPEVRDEFFVSFQPSEFRGGLSRAKLAVSKLRGMEFWVRLEMMSKGSPVGQVTRHFSRHYARRLLSACSLPLRASCGRAFLLGCAQRDLRP